MSRKVLIGQSYFILYPFVKGEHEYHSYTNGQHQQHTKPTWNPGCRFELTSPDDGEYFFDDMGEMILTVVDIHKPGKYPERVFYIREWITPIGKRFGKRNLRIITTGAFKRMLNGYRHECNRKPALTP